MRRRAAKYGMNVIASAGIRSTSQIADSKRMPISRYSSAAAPWRRGIGGGNPPAAEGPPHPGHPRALIDEPPPEPRGPHHQHQQDPQPLTGGPRPSLPPRPPRRPK